MTRTFYSMAYLVELDRCCNCRLIWFEKDELEILQCMIDNRMASRPMASQKSNILHAPQATTKKSSPNYQ